jgi:hypothetical protein
MCWVCSEDVGGAMAAAAMIVNIGVARAKFIDNLNAETAM